MGNEPSAQGKGSGWNDRAGSHCGAETRGVGVTLRNVLQRRLGCATMALRATESRDSRRGKGVATWAEGSSRNQRKDAFQEADGQQCQKVLRDLKCGVWSVEGQRGLQTRVLLENTGRRPGSCRRGTWAAPAGGKQLEGEQRGGRGVELRGRWRRVWCLKGSMGSVKGGGRA